MSQKDGDQMIQIETWQQSVLGVWSHKPTNVPANGGGGHSFPVKFCIRNHVNTTSVVSEPCWPLLNSEKNSD